MTVALFAFTDAHKRQFHDEGFVVLESVIRPADLAMLRDCCTERIRAVEAEMDEAGTDSMGLNHRGKRYFMGAPEKTHPAMWDFYFSDMTAQIVGGTLGPNAFLFAAQYTVKCAESGLKFAWHQDSAYVQISHRPTVNLWCTLDDMSQENGTLYLLPCSRAGTRKLLEHRRDADNDRVGYFGDDPGDPLNVPAGSIVAFGSLLFHRSGPNRSARPRRAITVEYTPEPIIDPQTGETFLQAEPFLKNGQRIDARSHHAS